MNIKSLLLGSAAALVAVSGARAADAVVVAEPEPMDYVRICDTYGTGFYYIPGTETCLKIDGYMRYQISAGERVDEISNSGDETYDKISRLQLRIDARNETELGTLRSFAAINFNYENGRTTTFTGTGLPGNPVIRTRGFDANDGIGFDHIYFELAGFLVGKTDSLFVTQTGYTGNVLSDGIVGYGPFATNTIRYTFTGSNGFSAAIALEEGDNDENRIIDDYVPHVVGGLAYTQGWGGVSAVAAYDSVSEEVAIKGRIDVNATEQLSLWLMAGYDTDGGPVVISTPALKGTGNGFASWGGEWAVWGGGSYTASEKVRLDAEIGYDELENFGAALALRYKLVPGLDVTPEVSYADNFDDNGDGEFGFRIRFQRNF